MVPENQIASGRRGFMISMFGRRRSELRSCATFIAIRWRGGLVDSPEQWHWSSFRWYSSGEVGPVRINDTDILVMTIRPPAA